MPSISVQDLLTSSCSACGVILTFPSSSDKIGTNSFLTRFTIHRKSINRVKSNQEYHQTGLRIASSSFHSQKFSRICGIQDLVCGIG